VKSGITIQRDHLAKLMQDIKRLSGHDVLVGIPETKADRYEDLKAARQVAKAGGLPLPGVNNAMIGYFHEMGAPRANIPARPFLVPGIVDATPRLVTQMRAGVEAALKGDSAGLDHRMHSAGMIAQNSVRAKINSGLPPPLSDRTIRARLARGRTGTVPLIDTGQLRNAITYVIRPK
jgi:hypothetical protein